MIFQGPLKALFLGIVAFVSLQANASNCLYALDDSQEHWGELASKFQNSGYMSKEDYIVHSLIHVRAPDFSMVPAGLLMS